MNSNATRSLAVAPVELLVLAVNAVRLATTVNRSSTKLHFHSAQINTLFKCSLVTKQTSEANL